MTTPPTNFLRQHEVPTPVPTPLSDQNMEGLQQVAALYRKIKRCGWVAAFSGISELVLGILGIGCLAVSFDFKGILAVAVLIGVGSFELVCRQKLLRGDRSAPKKLALNQLAFIAAITLYCVVQMATFDAKKSMREMSNVPGAENVDVNSLLGGDASKMAQQMVYLVYGLVAIVAWASQGGLALYYWLRKPLVEEFNATPEWQRQLVARVAS